MDIKKDLEHYVSNPFLHPIQYNLLFYSYYMNTRV
jgi:hypothetical protein